MDSSPFRRIAVVVSYFFTDRILAEVNK